MGLKNLGIKKKLLLMSAISFSVLLYFSALNIAEYYKVFKDSRYPLQLIKDSEKLSTLIHHLQIERGLSSGFITYGKGKEKPQNTRAKTDEVLLQIKDKIPSNLFSKLNYIREALDSQKITYEMVIQAYSEIY